MAEYKGYRLPYFELRELRMVGKKGLIEDACLGVLVNKVNCDYINDCTRCLFVQPRWKNCGGEARSKLVEYMVEHGCLSKADALEINLDNLSKKEGT